MTPRIATPTPSKNKHAHTPTRYVPFSTTTATTIALPDTMRPTAVAADAHGVCQPRLAINDSLRALRLRCTQSHTRSRRPHFHRWGACFAHCSALADPLISPTRANDGIE